MEERSPGDEFTSRRGKKQRIWSHRKSQYRQARTWVNVSVVGIQFPVAIGLGFFWGRWLDRQLNTWPWMTGVFSLFGIIAGFVNLFRITAAAEKAEQAEARLREAAGDENDLGPENG